MPIGHDLPAPAASRSAPGAGHDEHFELLRPPDRPALMAARAVPRGPCDGALVLCSSLHSQFLEHYRHEVLFARSLASAGIAAQRFHYRGTGNSDGDPEATTFDDLVDDARAAAAALRAATGVEAVRFAGSGFGALVAAAAGPPRSPLVLWDPVVDAARYFRDALRSALVASMKGSGTPDRSRTLDQRFDEDGRIDVLGWEIHRAIHDSSRGRSLEGLLERGTEVLVLHPPLAVDGPPEHPAVGRLREIAGRVEALAVDVPAASWLVSDDWASQGARGSADVGADVAAWLRARR